MTTTAVSAPEPELPNGGGITELIGQYTALSPLGEQQGDLATWEPDPTRLG